MKYLKKDQIESFIQLRMEGIKVKDIASILEIDENIIEKYEEGMKKMNELMISVNTESLKEFVEKNIMKRKKGTRELKEELESRKKFSIEREYEIQKIIEECEEAKRKLSEIDSLIKEQKNEKKRLAGTESLISNILDRK